MQTDRYLGELAQTGEPCIRYRVWTGVLGSDPASAEMTALREEIRDSPRAQTLLSEQGPDGTIPLRPYQKWRGAHWVLTALAETGYPPGDERLLPLREQELEWLFSEKHRLHIQTISGRVRRCTSQEGNALFSLLALGLADDRADELARRLIAWQWPDGGWNCDDRPEAHHSSFMESLIPLRALALHARLTGSPDSRAAAGRAAEFFLSHRLFRRSRDGAVIRSAFLRLHYPCYWHYDILYGLRVMAEAGCISDGRCQDALDLLEARRLASGGFPADEKYYRLGDQKDSQSSRVEWGAVGKNRPNEFVSAEAYAVLRAAGRLEPAGGNRFAPRTPDAQPANGRS